MISNNFSFYSGIMIPLSHQSMSNIDLILASQSKTRAHLLQAYGYSFKQMDPVFQDPPQPQIKNNGCIEQHAMELAVLKATSTRNFLLKEIVRPFILITADTMCINYKGLAISHPIDLDDARCILQSFSNHQHDVVTAVAMLRVDLDDQKYYPVGGELITFQDRVKVSFGSLDEEMIESYLNTNNWKGQAGAYNLRDCQHRCWPISVADGGDETSVEGLPMRQVVSILNRWKIHVKLNKTTSYCSN